MQVLYLATISEWPDVVAGLDTPVLMTLIGGVVAIVMALLLIVWRYASIAERIKRFRLKMPKGSEGQHVEVELHLSPPVEMEGSAEEEMVENDGTKDDGAELEPPKRRRQKRPPTAS